MPSSFFSDPAAPWQVYRQHQQRPNQGPAGTTALPSADLEPLDENDDEASSLDGGTGDDSVDVASTPDSSTGGGDHDDPPAATTSTADPLRAERRRSNQLEKELRKARAQRSSNARWPIANASSTRPTCAACAALKKSGTRPAVRCRTCARSGCWNACSARQKGASAAMNGGHSLTPS